jgi:hypothetical protein
MEEIKYAGPLSYGSFDWPRTCGICGAMVERHEVAEQLHSDWHKVLDEERMKMRYAMLGGAGQ